MHAGSKWTTDSELVQRRRERAYSFIKYAPIHDFVEGPSDFDDEEEEVSEDKEEVDEEIKADPAPDTAAGTAAETAAEADAETHVPPTDPSASGPAV